MDALNKFLRGNLKTIGCDRTSSGNLFFPNESYANDYVDLFCLHDRKDRFIEAFKIVTHGVGSEVLKVNSLISSSLLSLLTFYPLFEYNSGEPDCQMEVGENEQFKSCLFEVRNQVITLPSCVDILLKNDKKWLFLESKLYEPLRDAVSRLEIRRGYHDLYENPTLSGILRSQEIFVTKSSDKLYLQTFINGRKPQAQTKKYLYGIKQVISHLIGLVKGPKEYNKSQPGYPKDYYTGWNGNIELSFGLILYHSSQNDVSDYMKLYRSIFCGDNGRDILKAIEQWANKKGFSNLTPINSIEIIPPITYQETFTSTKNNFLDEKVAKFYGLG